MHLFVRTLIILNTVIQYIPCFNGYRTIVKPIGRVCSRVSVEGSYQEAFGGFPSLFFYSCSLK